jgi:hypothetical protein
MLTNGGIFSVSSPAENRVRTRQSGHSEKNEPSGPFTSSATFGVTAALPRVFPCGRSTKFSETSGGTDTADRPTRDWAGDEVEKHCGRWGWEKAGVKKAGKALCLREVREKCLKQVWGMAHDMVPD